MRKGLYSEWMTKKTAGLCLQITDVKGQVAKFLWIIDWDVGEETN